ncbi:MAG: AI-2E family transporter [Lachnospirales bacterium]
MQLLKSGILCLALWTLCILLGTGSLSWLLGALSPLAMTICIIYLLQPFVNNLQEFSSLPRSICILLIFLSLLGILLFFLFLLLPRLSDAFSRLLRVDWTALLRHPFLQTLAAYLPLEDWLGRLPQLLGSFLTPLLRVSTSVIQWVGNLFMAFCISYYALKDSRSLGRSLSRYILRLLPQKAAALLLNIMDILDQCLSAYLRGRCQISLLLTAAVSLLLFFLSWILRMDLPSPLLFGVIIGLTNLIPLVGPFLGTGLCLLLALLQGPPQMLLVLAISLGAQFWDNLYLTPRLGAPFGLSPFWILLGVSTLGILWGIWGMLFSIPVLGSIAQIWRKLQVEKNFLWRVPERFRP